MNSNQQCTIFNDQNDYPYLITSCSAYYFWLSTPYPRQRGTASIIFFGKCSLNPCL